MNSYSAYSFTDNFLSPVLLRKFDASSIEEMKMIKHKLFDEKQQKNANKICVNKTSILYSELAPPSHDITCSKPSRYEEDMSDKKLSVKHPLW